MHKFLKTEAEIVRHVGAVRTASRWRSARTAGLTTPRLKFALKEGVLAASCLGNEFRDVMRHRPTPRHKIALLAGCEVQRRNVFFMFLPWKNYSFTFCY